LLAAVETSFADVLSSGEGTSNSTSYFLQTESSEWGRIDLTGGVQDRATVYLCCSAAGASAGVSTNSVAVACHCACSGSLCQDCVC
jgi:hypothetical protein